MYMYIYVCVHKYPYLSSRMTHGIAADCFCVNKKQLVDSRPFHLSERHNAVFSFSRNRHGGKEQLILGVCRIQFFF